MFAYVVLCVVFVQYMLYKLSLLGSCWFMHWLVNWLLFSVTWLVDQNFLS